MYKHSPFFVHFCLVETLFQILYFQKLGPSSQCYHHWLEGPPLIKRKFWYKKQVDVFFLFFSYLFLSFSFFFQFLFFILLFIFPSLSCKKGVKLVGGHHWRNVLHSGTGQNPMLPMTPMGRCEKSSTTRSMRKAKQKRPITKLNQQLSLKEPPTRNFSHCE